VRLFVFVSRCLTAAALAVLSFQSGGILRNTRKPGGLIGRGAPERRFVPTDSLAALRRRLRKVGARAMKKLSLLCAIAIGMLTSAAGAADLTLYTDGDFAGRPLNVVIDMRQLGSMNFDKRASSLVIEKDAWVVCTGEDFTGSCKTLEPGRYPSLRELGLDDAITSVRRRDAVSPGVFN
jgi:hypothetical protein